jgi:predicted ATPase
VAELPAGTVTFLFTDIEGSTALLEDLGEGYGEALISHRALLREVFGAYGGVEVDNQGDAFFFVFPDGREAAAAAAAGQEALAAGPVRVRMGLHTGTPSQTDEGYFGRDVNLGARVAAAAHGGQVVLSKATRDLLDGPAVRDLGEHRVKDFDQPVWIYQLGDETFPPLKTISNTNLPRPASSFVGREREVADVIALVRDGARLVTLTGPGGTGKTRLAIETAAELVPEFKAGIFWVGLATLRDPTLVVETIAQTLGAKGELLAHIGERELLLLLDNLEQVVDAAPSLAELVEACPNLTVLTTSRELLRVRGEVEYQVLPLAEPDAVELFCARARIEPNASVEELCRRLDNMPLALELAAARARALTVEQILERLSQRLDLFRGGRDADPRQQTLRATIEWSYELLSPEEQQLFARVAVFAGGCTLEAAEEVCHADLDTLQSLLDKSLLRRTGDRFWMLETIRDYAAEQLDHIQEARELCERHAEYYLRLSSGVDRELRGQDQDEWMKRIGQQHSNFAAAMTFYADKGPAESALRIGAELARYWARRGAVAEGRTLIERALRVSSTAQPQVRAKALWAGAHLAYMQDDFNRERVLHEEARVLFSAIGDAEGKLLTEIELAWMRLALGQKAAITGKADQCVADARALGDTWLLAFALQLRGAVLSEGDQFEEAKLAFAQSVALFDSVGDSRSALAAGSTLGWIAVLTENYEEAASLLTAALDRASESDSELLSINRSNLGLANLFLGNDQQAADDFCASIALCAEMDARRLAAEALLGLAAVAAKASHCDVAARLRATSLAFHEASGTPLTPAEQRLEDRFLLDLKEQAVPTGEPGAPITSLHNAAAYAADFVATVRSASLA